MTTQTSEYNTAKIRLVREGNIYGLVISLRYSKRATVDIFGSQQELYGTLDKRLTSLRYQKMKITVVDSIKGITNTWQPLPKAVKPSQKPRFVVPKHPKYTTKRGKIETVALTDKDVSICQARRLVRRWTKGIITIEQLLSDVEFTK